MYSRRGRSSIEARKKSLRVELAAAPWMASPGLKPRPTPLGAARRNAVAQPAKMQTRKFDQDCKSIFIRGDNPSFVAVVPEDGHQRVVQPDPDGRKS
jgi:hypothetical protein